MLNATLQDWTTIRGSGTTSVVQSASDWIDAEGFADIVFWLDVREVTNPGGGNVSLVYETAPVRDESLFQPMASVPMVTVGGPTITKVMLTASSFVPLGRYARWRLVGTAAGVWDVTFRVEASLGKGATGAFSPLKLPGLLLWLRADQGVTLSGGKVASWADQSGNGNHVSQAASGSRPSVNATGINGLPAIDFAGGTWLENAFTSLVGSNSAYSVLVAAKNGNGSIFALRRSIPCSISSFAGPISLGTMVAHSDDTSAVTIGDVSSQTQSPTTPFMSAHIYAGSSATPVVYLNAVSTPASGSQVSESGTTGFMVGSNPGGGLFGSVPWSGLIGEIIVCSGAIAAADRLNVEAYQLAYWGV